MQRRLQISFLTLFLSMVYFRQIGDAQTYTWMKGPGIVDQPGNYGVQGAFAMANNPGARIGSVSWVDGAGNLWLFGGRGFDVSGTFGFLNDLWKFDPVNNLWVWIKGDSLVNQVGKYGSLGVATATNQPGSRMSGCAWADNNGNLYLFGGYGYDTSNVLDVYFNDLWKYNIGSNQWTWIHGSNQLNQPGFYGTTPGPLNIPTSRVDAVGFKDNSGYFWLFGGVTPYNNPSNGYMNDLWKYNTVSNEWTWMGGSANGSTSGVYGTQNVPNSLNSPGGRFAARGVADGVGNLWIFGGTGYDATANLDQLNDLWKYNIATQQWTWVSGSTLIWQPGVYGVQGVPSNSAVPGARTGGYLWTDKSNNLWLFWRGRPGISVIFNGWLSE